MEGCYTVARDQAYSHHCLPSHCQRNATIPLPTECYHPIANGMVERFRSHHSKASLQTDMLYLALLGIRTSLKEDLICTMQSWFMALASSFLHCTRCYKSRSSKLRDSAQRQHENFTLHPEQTLIWINDTSPMPSVLHPMSLCIMTLSTKHCSSHMMDFIVYLTDLSDSIP